mgnify:CR=1 FL=1
MEKMLIKFLKQIWEKDVNEACANTHNFIVHQNSTESSNEVKIIDLNFDSDYAGTNDDGELDVHVFSPFGNKSILRDFDYQSTLPSALSATIAISAQSPNNEGDLDAVSFAYFNKFTKNRFSKGEESSDNIGDRSVKRAQFAQKRETLREYLLNLGRYKIGTPTQGNLQDGMLPQSYYGYLDKKTAYSTNRHGEPVTVNEIKSQIESLEDLTVDIASRYYEDDPTNDPKTYYAGFKRSKKDKLPPKRSSIIPLKFNARLDGISGIVIGNIFKIDESMLPVAYKDKEINFVVTGESQKITTGQDWTTDIHGQLILANKDDSESLEIKGPSGGAGINLNLGRSDNLPADFQTTAINMMIWLVMDPQSVRGKMLDADGLNAHKSRVGNGGNNFSNTMLSVQGACALLGNAYAESKFDPAALEKPNSFDRPYMDKNGGRPSKSMHANAVRSASYGSHIANYYQGAYTGDGNALFGNSPGLDPSQSDWSEGGVGLFQFTGPRRRKFETSRELWRHEPWSTPKDISANGGSGRFIGYSFKAPSTNPFNDLIGVQGSEYPKDKDAPVGTWVKVTEPRKPGISEPKLKDTYDHWAGLLGMYQNPTSSADGFNATKGGRAGKWTAKDHNKAYIAALRGAISPSCDKAIGAYDVSDPGTSTYFGKGRNNPKHQELNYDRVWDYIKII